MLPDPHLNFNAPVSEFLAPDNQIRCDLLRDQEMGALAVNDPTGGLMQAVWEGWLDGQTLRVRPLPDGTITDVLTVAGTVTELSLAFDSNMRPHFAFVEDGDTKLYWYNTGSGHNETLTLAGATSPRLCLDDKRDRESASRDILLFYLRSGSLYCRQQRDRYEIEHFLIDTAAVRIGQVGMAKGSRVQIELLTDDTCGPEGNFLLFSAVTGAYKNSVYASNTVTSDICIMPKSVVSIVDGEYSLNGGDWTDAVGLGSPGDTFQVRRQSANTFETTVTCTLTVGWYSGVFSITTMAQGPCQETPYARPDFDAADADFSAQSEYARPDFDAADAAFLPICE